MKKLVLVLSMAVMITALSACGTETPSASSTISSTDSSVEATNVSSATNTTAATAAKDTPSVADKNSEEWTPIGKTVTVEGVQYTVNSFKNTKGPESFPADEGKTYILTDITVKNNTKEEAVISSIMGFYLTDADGKEYDTALFGSMMGLDDAKLEQLDFNVAAAAEKRGGLGFEIPENAKGLTLVVKELLGDGKQKVKLN